MWCAFFIDHEGITYALPRICFTILKNHRYIPHSSYLHLVNYTSHRIRAQAPASKITSLWPSLLRFLMISFKISWALTWTSLWFKTNSTIEIFLASRMKLVCRISFRLWWSLGPILKGNCFYIWFGVLFEPDYSVSVASLNFTMPSRTYQLSSRRMLRLRWSCFCLFLKTELAS